MTHDKLIGHLTQGIPPVNLPAAETTITTGADGLTAGEVRVPVPDGAIPAYRAMPESGGPFPIILVVQEIFGANEHIQDVCRRFAKEGFCAIAPEMYARYGAVEDAEDLQDLFVNMVMKVPDAEVMSDLDACVAWAEASGNGDVDRLSVTGFCWGGRITWLYAAHQSGLKAGVAWYGRLIGTPSEHSPQRPIDVADALHAPVLGLYGEDDDGIPVETVDEMREALAAANDPSQFVVYPEAPHGFHSDYRTNYHEPSAKAGWVACLAWLHDHGAG